MTFATTRTRAPDPFEYDEEAGRFWMAHADLQNIVSKENFVVGALFFWNQSSVLEEMNNSRAGEPSNVESRGFSRFRHTTHEQFISMKRFLEGKRLRGFDLLMYSAVRSLSNLIRKIRGKHLVGHELSAPKHGANQSDSLQSSSGHTGLEKKELSRLLQLLSLGKAHRTIVWMGILAAITQGWDQVSMNGANLDWPLALGLQVPRLTPDSVTDQQLYRIDLTRFAIANAAPWFSGAIIGSLFTDYFINERQFGRRLAIAFAASFSVASVVGAAFAQDWKAFIACRVLLGIGMGGKASIVPIYISEIAPDQIRGMLIMYWQLSDTFGIFLGSLSNLMVFLDSRTGSDWRLMIALPFIPALMLLTLIPFCVESPRWLLKQNRTAEALQSLIQLYDLPSPMIACGELFNTFQELKREEREWLGPPDSKELGNINEVEPSTIGEANQPIPDESSMMSSGSSNSSFRNTDNGVHSQPNDSEVDRDGLNGPHDIPRRENHRLQQTSLRQRLKLFLTIPRIRNATYASACVMFAQQACGINILIFMSSTIYESVIASERRPNGSLDASEKMTILGLSLAIGFVNHLGTWLSFPFIDRQGRRFMLKLSFPLMALLLFICGIVLYKTPSLVTSYWVFFTLTLLFVVAFSIGEGPVAFVVSAEVFPLLVRELGMSLAVRVVLINFLFAGVLTLSVPYLAIAGFKGWFWFLFGGLNIIILLLAYVFVQDTHEVLLETIDVIYKREKKAWLIENLDNDSGSYQLGQKLQKRYPWFAPEEKVSA